MSGQFDMEEFKNEIVDCIQEILDDQLDDQLYDVLCNAIQDFLPEALSECLESYEFVLKDGTIAVPKKRMKLLNPDKSKLVLCYGGLIVDGCSLSVQTRVSSWTTVATYKSREEAIDALQKVKSAMDNGIESYEMEPYEME